MACYTGFEQEIGRFLEGAKGGLNDLRKDRLTRLRQETPRFFEGARQGLHVLRPVVIELDRHLAREFNIFCAIELLGSISQKKEDRMSDVLRATVKCCGCESAMHHVTGVAEESASGCPWGVRRPL